MFILDTTVPQLVPRPNISHVKGILPKMVLMPVRVILLMKLCGMHGMAHVLARRVIMWHRASQAMLIAATNVCSVTLVKPDGITRVMPVEP